MDSAAIISPCGKYRYCLTRIWDISRPMMCWVMLNPSTADASKDDPTIRKCIKFAQTWGFGGMAVVNLFAFRATDPKELKGLSRDDAVGPENDSYILRQLFSTTCIVVAWGQNGRTHGRASEILNHIRKLRGLSSVYALKTSKDGTPYHPLYQRDDTQPFPLR